MAHSPHRQWKGCPLCKIEVERRTEAVKKYGAAGVKTGFPTLDERTGGPQPRQTWIVGGRLGEGKTWTMLRMATTAVN